jgi:hypothetical protein
VALPRAGAEFAVYPRRARQPFQNRAGSTLRLKRSA